MLNNFKKNKPLLSVIIPSYNHEKYIGQAIESVLNQKYSNLELIIVDDGSKDNSIEIIKKYNDVRIKLICQENQGAHNAINHGLSETNGEYIAILNSDDVFEKNRFSRMITEMEKDKSIGLMCSYICIIDENGKKLGVKEGWNNLEPWAVKNPQLTYKITNDFNMNLIMSNFTSTTSNFLFTRALYDKIGGMRNLRFVHDWDFALRAVTVCKCKILEETLMQYRIHTTNTISSNRKWMLFEIVWIWAIHMEKLSQNVIFNTTDTKRDFSMLLESINTQGNDRLLWAIKVFIDAQKKKGIENPEEVLLEDNDLRESLLVYISE